MTAEKHRRLNLGCGHDILPEWTNVDRVVGTGVDVVADLARCASEPLPFESNSIDQFILSHILEHIPDQLALMQELHRIATPEARAMVVVPYGSSDDAFEDPTHVRPMFIGTFGYFSQPYYWRADYGYRGDWQMRRVTLIVSEAENAGLSTEQIMHKVKHLRNVVREMRVELIAVKPAREARRELMVDEPHVEVRPR